MPIGRETLVLAVLALAGATAQAPVSAQTTFSISDYQMGTGYYNVRSGYPEGVETATVPKKLPENMLTPTHESFRVCVFTATKPYTQGQQPIFAKKMTWKAIGVPSGIELAAGKVKGKVNELRCQDAEGLQVDPEDEFILWTAVFKMGGNTQFDGYFVPNLWTFPVADAAAVATPIALRTGLLTPEGFARRRDDLRESLGGPRRPAD